MLLLWTSNNESYARGLARNSMPDMTFYPRVIQRLEPKVPMALVEEKEIAKALERRMANHSNGVGLECTLE